MWVRSQRYIWWCRAHLSTSLSPAPEHNALTALPPQRLHRGRESRLCVVSAAWRVPTGAASGIGSRLEDGRGVSLRHHRCCCRDAWWNVQ